MHRPLIARTLLALGLALALAQQPALAQQAGDMPVIQGQTLAGAPFDLAALRGKVVLVLFWSTDCAVCRDKMPELRANAQGWKGKPFELVSVSFDRREQDALNYENLVATLAPSQPRPVALWAGNPAYKASENRPAQLPSAWLLDKSGKRVQSWTGRIPADAWDLIADLL